MNERAPQTEAELVDFLRAIEEPAPAGLQERIDVLVADSSAVAPRGGARRRRARTASSRGPLLAGGLAACAAAILAIALILGGGSGTPAGTPPTLHAASALTLARPTLPAPGESPRDDTLLAARVEGVSFPYWEQSFGWRAVGARADHIAGRPVRTVFYADGQGRRIGYAILAGPAPKLPAGGLLARSRGTSYRLLTIGGARAVVWLRAGHLCVVSGRGVDDATLLRLASWGESDRRTAA